MEEEDIGVINMARRFVYDEEGRKIYVGDTVECIQPIYDFSGSDVPMIEEGERKKVTGINISGNLEFGDIRPYYNSFEPEFFRKIKRRKRK
jgi:hypothetical protein